MGFFNSLIKETKGTIKEVSDLFRYNKSAVITAALPITSAFTSPGTKTVISKVLTKTGSLYSSLFKAAPKTTIALSAVSIPVSQAILKEPTIVTTSAKAVGDASSLTTNILVDLARKDYKDAASELLAFGKAHPYASTAAAATAAFFLAKSVSPIAAYIAGKSLISDSKNEVSYLNPDDLLPKAKEKAEKIKDKAEKIKDKALDEVIPSTPKDVGIPKGNVPSTPMPSQVPVPTAPILSPINKPTTTKARVYHRTKSHSCKHLNSARLKLDLNVKGYGIC